MKTKRYVRAAYVFITVLLVLTLAGCGGSGAEFYEGNKSGATLKGQRGPTSTKASGGNGENGADYDQISGEYDAVFATINDEDEMWLEEGEYLLINEDGSISMYVAGQALDYDTVLEDDEFYLDGDTRVGGINSDGSITLNLSDDVKYTFAKVESSLWNEWREAMGYDTGSWAEGGYDPNGEYDPTSGEGQEE